GRRGRGTARHAGAVRSALPPARPAGPGVRPEPRLRLPRRLRHGEGSRRARAAPALHTRCRPRPDLGMVSQGRPRPPPRRLHHRASAPRPDPVLTVGPILVYYLDPAEARAYARFARP